MGKLLPIYRCAQKDLYSVVKMGWANYALHQGELADYKGFYSVAYGVEALNELAAAQALPDLQARGTVSEMERIVLVDLGLLCLKYMQFLKGYIESAFERVEMWKSQFEAIGWTYYLAASKEDWESMVVMNQSAVNYLAVADIETRLGANDNMPSDFVAKIGDAAAAFAGKYADFLGAKDTSVETEAKIVANNACYRRLLDMMKDGQRVFGGDAAMAGRFTFAKLLHSVNPRVAGVKGWVKEVDSYVPIEAKVVAQKMGDVAVEFGCEADGSFSRILSAGKYSITIMALGYVTQVLVVYLKLKGLKRLKVVMVKG